MFVIKAVGVEKFVHSFNRTQQIVTFTYDVDAAKTFNVASGADWWIRQYSDVGFGLRSSDVVVVRP